MKFLSFVLLGLLAIFSVTSPTTLHAAVSGNHNLFIVSINHPISAPGLVSGDQLLEFSDDIDHEDLLNEQKDHQLNDEQIRRLYLKLLLIKGVGN